MGPTRVVLALKAGIALAGIVLLAWHAWSRGRWPSDGWQRQLDGRALAALGTAAFLAWWNLGYFHFGNFVHVHEFFHYFLGAKYHRELGYTHLYECAAAADAQQRGVTPAYSGWSRDLVTNTLVPDVALLGGRTECPERFGPDRWDAFVDDVQLLHGFTSSDVVWLGFRQDHGYNATPVWTAAGSWLTNVRPATEGFLVGLSLIDPLLLLAAAGLIWWAFGWSSLCVCLLWWGTNYPARFYWTGGAFVRADWLVLTVAAVALLRRNRPGLAGAALGWATLLRVFPAFLLVPWLIAEATRLRRRGWRPSSELSRVLGGFALAILVLLPASSLLTSGRLLDVDAWRGFVDNSRKHYQSPSTNALGLRALVAFDPATRAAALTNDAAGGPWAAWTEARRQTFAERAHWFWISAFGLIGVLGLGARNRPAWEALALGVLVLPLALQLSSYYYSVLLLLGVLWSRHPWTGVALLGASLTTALAPAIFVQDDEIFALVNAAVVTLAVAMTTWAWWTSATLPTHRAAASPGSAGLRAAP